MADRGRDLKFDILSDTSKFDLGDPADQLDDLAKNSEDAADELKRLAAQGKDAQKQLDELAREAADNKFDDYGRDAKTAARKVDDAFDSIAKSAKTNMKKVDDEGRTGFKDFKDEAHGSGREAAASFSGGFDDITGFLQETAAQAFGGFGPGGAALGIVAAAGIGIATALWGKSQEDAQALKEQITDLFDALVEGQGKIREASVMANVNDLVGDPDKFKELKKEAADAGVSVSTYARAVSGSIPDQQRISNAIDTSKEALKKKVAVDIYAKQKLDAQGEALDKVAKRLGITKGATKDALTQWEVADQAMRDGIIAPIDVKAPTAAELAAQKTRLQRGIGSIPVGLQVKPPPPSGPNSSANAAEQALRQAQAYANRRPVEIRWKFGSKPEKDIP